MHCNYCGSRRFREFSNGSMIWVSCENNCLGTIEIYQFGKDDFQIKNFIRRNRRR